jgi:hypothetical protein
MPDNVESQGGLAVHRKEESHAGLDTGHEVKEPLVGEEADAGEPGASRFEQEDGRAHDDRLSQPGLQSNGHDRGLDGNTVGEKHEREVSTGAPAAVGGEPEGRAEQGRASHASPVVEGDAAEPSPLGRGLGLGSREPSRQRQGLQNQTSHEGASE